MFFKSYYFLKAIRHEDMAKAKSIVSRGVDVNTHNSDGDTALIIAIDKSNVDLFKFLLEAGADVNQANFMGVTPLMTALRWNWLVARLEQHGHSYAKPKRKKALAADTAIHFLFSIFTNDSGFNQFSSPYVELLIKGGANVNSVNIFGFTAMDCAGLVGDISSIKLLLKAGGKFSILFTDTGLQLMAITNTNKNNELLKIIIANKGK